jgi:hypothetical protein
MTPRGVGDPAAPHGRGILLVARRLRRALGRGGGRIGGRVAGRDGGAGRAARTTGARGGLVSAGSTALASGRGHGPERHVESMARGTVDFGAVDGGIGPVCDPARAGPGDLRRRLPGVRPTATPRGGAEGAAGGGPGDARGPRAVPQGGDGRRGIGPPPHRAGLRSRGGGRGLLHRLGLLSGDHAGGLAASAPRAGVLPRGGRAGGHAGRGRRACSPARGPSPRPEAQQRPAGDAGFRGAGRRGPERWLRPDTLPPRDRLRPGQTHGCSAGGGLRVQSDPQRRHHGESQLHGAGAGRGSCWRGRPGRRHL